MVDTVGAGILEAGFRVIYVGGISVGMGGEQFGFLPVKMGFLQGAILYPVLFPIYINYIDSSIRWSYLTCVECIAVLLILFNEPLRI